MRLFIGLAVAATLAAQIKYTLSADSQVTVAIDDAQGRRVRNLIGGAPRSAGAQTEPWDLLDDAGNPVPVGRYRYRVLHHTGVGIDYLMSYGNPGNPPWATADTSGGWGADHSLPQAALTVPNGVVLGWPMAESGWFLIGVGSDGRKQWGIKNRYAFGDTRIHLATDGEFLYVASEQNPAPLMRYYKKQAHSVLYRYRLSDRKLAPFGVAGDNSDEIVLTDKMDGNVSGLALAGDTAFISLTRDDRIIAVSLRTGALTPALDVSFPAPQALQIEHNNLDVLSGKQIHRVDLATRKSVALISTGLDDPGSFTLGSDGAIYVSDRGAAQQVKVFTRDGGPARTIGVAGGRTPRGTHNPQGIYRPIGLTVDAKNQLWVMEADDRPQRASVWNAATGAFLHEFIGAPHYGALDGSVAAFDRTMAFGEGVQYRLDWSAKTYTYVGTPGRGANDEDVFGRAVVRRTFQQKGRILTASNQHVQVVAELRDGVLHPLAAIGEIDELTRRLGMYTGAIARKIEELKKAGATLDAKGNPKPSVAFIWTDRNGDGIAQDSEFVWKPDLRLGSYWGSSIGEDFTVYTQSSGNQCIYRFPVTAWTPAGAPMYTFETATKLPHTGSAEHVSAMPDGMLIVNAKPQLQGIDSKSGKTLWTYPNPWEGVHGSHTADVPAPGRLIGPISTTGYAKVGGEVGTLFAMNGNLAQQFLFTSDGLWVGAVMRDWRLARVEDMYTVPDEDFGGYFWRDEKSGEVYLEAGKSEYRVYRVTGLESVHRAEGSITVAKARAPVTKAPRLNIPEVAVTRQGAPLKFTEVAADENSKFKFALAYDDANLYLTYDVTDDSPFENTGQIVKQMFNTGDCVDLMFNTNRLLLTVKDNKPLAVLYKQTDPTRTWPVPFISPSRAVYFGNVIELPDAKIEVTRTKSSYLLKASVPLKTLGIQPSAKVVPGDAGVIFGSQSGNGARLRLYWCNKATAITSDIPSEAALQPENWGKLRFEQ